MYYVATPKSPFARLRKGFAKFFAGRARPRTPSVKPLMDEPIRPAAPLPSSELSHSIAPSALAACALTVVLFWTVLPRLEPSWLTAILLQRGPLQPVTVGAALMGLFAILQRVVGGFRERRAARQVEAWFWPHAPMSTSAARAWIAERGGAGRDWATRRLSALIDAVASGEPGSTARDRLEKADRRTLQDLHQAPRAALNTLPLLGLGGTVLGLSAGMGRLSGFIQGANDIAGLREVLTGFSGSLATAFNSTLLALALMAPLFVLASVVRGRDEATLRLIDGLAERLSKLIERNEQPNVDELVVQRASERVVAAVERGIGELFARHGKSAEAEGRDALTPQLADVLAELPRAFEALRAALNEPRVVDIRVAAEPNAKEH